MPNTARGHRGSSLAASNPFDQFDAAPAAPAATANPFDQFDTKSSPALERFGTGMLDPVYGAGQAEAHTLPDAGAALIGAMPKSMQDKFGGVPPPASQTADKTVQQREATIKAQEPPGTDWARMAGEIASPINYLPTAAAGPVMKGMEIGARSGAMEPVTEGNYDAEKGKQIELGAATGLGTGLVAKGIGAAVTPKTMPTSVPSATGMSFAAPKTVEEAKSIASQLYTKASQAGGELTPQFTNDFLDTAAKLTPQTSAGQVVRGETPLTSLINRMEALRDQPISLQAAQEIDEGIGNLIDNEYGVKGLTKDGKQLLDLQSTFRNMISKAGPDETTGGVDGFNALKDARGAWSQSMKMSDLERIQMRADLMDNPATGIRSGIRTLLSNKPASRGYNDEEIAALKSAASRGALGSTLQILGSRLIPIAHAATGDVVGAVASHGLSSGMRAGASAVQSGRLQDAMGVLGARVPGAYTPPPWAGVARTVLGNTARGALPYAEPAAMDYLDSPSTPQAGFGNLRPFGR
jgi:hypothetical protein